ncbi:phage tail sheath family protein [Sphaerotilus mobilis]|uniref:Tail sheath protein C-terminal domain-containing protein n=1 Tax=Sphaerotilus mobilis TaxID=47994 RepID=A0A4Q7LV90_9BURK|nr:phage tail sheath subtilisin-like domain-containing protein [Sphaerotilus mobilis]RZS58591.1 hypothetical protein EV685_0886 [Sphaerotilus mobilis]
MPTRVPVAAGKPGTSFLAPGVFIEEIANRTPAIVGVPSTVAGFVGPTHGGPTHGGPLGGVPVALTSLGEFERLHGDGRPLDFGGQVMPHHLWHAARAFFADGGRRLHIARVFRPDPAATAAGASPDGIARQVWGGVTWRAQHPGRSGNLGVRLTLRNGLRQPDGQVLPAAWAQTRADLLVTAADGQVLGHWTDLGVDPAAAPADGRRWLFEPAGARPAADALPVVIGWHGRPDAQALLRELAAPLGVDLADAAHWASGVVVDLALTGGHDGLRPGLAEFAGPAGIASLDAIEDLTLVAAPGCTAPVSGEPSAPMPADAPAVLDLLVAHAQRHRFRVALLDAAPAASTAEVQALRARFDARCAALYHPWVQVADPRTGQALRLPPSGFVAGLIARVDAASGVWKSPAGALPGSVTGLALTLSKAELERLNAAGVNTLRDLGIRGRQVWGARTLASDPQDRYLSVVRSIGWLQRSIEASIGWTVFETHGDALWSRVRGALEDFLLTVWRQGMLQGLQAEQAFFVRCDRSTMTQADLDAGRLVCLIGVAPIRPAEFMVFQVSARTAGTA